jgi:hypothetical protein
LIAVDGTVAREHMLEETEEMLKMGRVENFFCANKS